MIVDGKYVFTMAEKLEFIAMKIDAARQHIVLNQENEHIGLEVNSEIEKEAKDWADNEMIKWARVFQTIIKADGPFHGIEYCWQSFVDYKVNHFDDDLTEDTWYATFDDFLEGQLAVE